MKISRYVKLTIEDIPAELFAAMVKHGLDNRTIRAKDAPVTGLIWLGRENADADRMIQWLGNTNDTHHPGSYDIYEPMIQEWTEVYLYREETE